MDNIKVGTELLCIKEIVNFCDEGDILIVDYITKDSDDTQSLVDVLDPFTKKVMFIFKKNLSRHFKDNLIHQRVSKIKMLKEKINETV